MLKKVLFFIFLLILFANTFSQKNSPSPSISCQNPCYNVGKVNANKKSISHTFIIKNIGDKKLIIKKIIPTCGCTKYNISKKELNPGETTSVSITVNISDKFGNFEEGLYLKTNDSKSPTFYLCIKGNVIVDYLIYPETIYFGKFHPREYKNQKDLFNLRIFSKKIKGISSINIDNPLLGYNTKFDKKNNIYTIILYFKKKPSLGYREGLITITLDSNKEIQKKVAYSYEVVPEIKVSPEGINLSTLKENYPHISFFYIYFKTPFKILDVSLPKGFSYEIEKIKSKTKICIYKFKLILLDENFCPKWETKNILIRTSFEKDPLIDIKIINNLKK